MSVEQGPLQNTAQIRHLPNTIKQKLWVPSYDVIVPIGRAAMHFLRLRHYSASTTLVGEAYQKRPRNGVNHDIMD